MNHFERQESPTFSVPTAQTHHGTVVLAIFHEDDILTVFFDIWEIKPVAQFLLAGQNTVRLKLPYGCITV